MLKRFLPVLLLLASCGNGLPKDVLPKEKMGKVLWDAAQGGEYANGYLFTKYYQINHAALTNELLEKIYKVHGITKKQFDKSLEYYRSNPKELKIILDSITAQKARSDNERRSNLNDVTSPGPMNVPGGIAPRTIQ